MILPHIEHAVVPQEKITDYLLSDSHPQGRAKAEFFRGFGFTVAEWPVLAEALLNHVREHGIIREEPSPFGVRYIAEGPLAGADGRRPNLRSVWFLDHNSTSPRLVTAYPLEGAGDD